MVIVRRVAATIVAAIAIECSMPGCSDPSAASGSSSNGGESGGDPCAQLCAQTSFICTSPGGETDARVDLQTTALQNGCWLDYGSGGGYWGPFALDCGSKQLCTSSAAAPKDCSATTPVTFAKLQDGKISFSFDTTKLSLSQYYYPKGINSCTFSP